jgi:hypothetical protein
MPRRPAACVMGSDRYTQLIGHMGRGGNSALFYQLAVTRYQLPPVTSYHPSERSGQKAGFTTVLSQTRLEYHRESQRVL